MVIAGVLSRAAFAAEADSPELPGNSATAQELPQVIVIGNAPLLGFGLPLNQVPSNVQTADSQDLKRAQSAEVTEYFNSAFSGVNVSESADNPFQRDINYHGFTASPLLGTPEGLSVYVDGVRVNESFGDTVNWDLIPESAISTVSLISGSNPVFGLNTLGRARALRLLRHRSVLRRDRLARHVSNDRLAGLRQSGLAKRHDRCGPQLHLRGYAPVRQRCSAVEHALLPTRPELHPRLHPQPAALREPHRHAVSVRPPVAFGERLHPPSDHRQQQRQQQR